MTNDRMGLRAFRNGDRDASTDMCHILISRVYKIEETI